jgi:ABC-type multidrug transport system ATPase subunit
MLLRAHLVRTKSEAGLVSGGLSFETAGQHVMLVSPPRGVFEAIAGIDRIVAGELWVQGTTPEQAVRERAVAGAPCDPVLPAGDTPQAYLESSARLAGLSRQEASHAVDDALTRFQLKQVAELPIRRATRATRRGIVAAAAYATGASCIVLESPFEGLEDAEARDYARVLAKALDERAWVMTVGSVPLGFATTTHSDEVLLFAGHHLVAQGAPEEVASEERIYVVRTLGTGEALRAALVDRGLHVRGPEQAMVVQLDDGRSATDLFQIAQSVDEVLLEVRPLAYGFR